MKVFISYSHKDNRYFNEFITHLKGLERIIRITHWYDGCINPGEAIDPIISKRINEADLIFLLISPNFIASSYCYETELGIAYQRCNNDECLVIPVLIKNIANREQYPFAKYKIIPEDARPVSKYRPISDGFVNVMKEVYSTVNDYCKKTDKKKLDKVTSGNKANKMYLSVVSKGRLSNKLFTIELYNEMQKYIQKQEQLEKRLTAHLANSILEFQRKYQLEKNKKTYINWHYSCFVAYSLQLLEYIKKILNNGVFALHLRWLKNKSFISFVNSGYIDSPFLSVHSLPEDDPMIAAAFNLNLPIIKSLNTQLHKKTHNDEKNQRDYITCAFLSVKRLYKEELSLCISCNNHKTENSANQLLIMSLFRIDKQIESFLLSYIEACKSIDERFNLKKIGDRISL